MAGEQLHTTAEDVVGIILQTGIVILHMGVHRVAAAPADGVVGMILNEFFPEVLKIIARIAACKAHLLRHGIQGLDAALEGILRLRVGLLEVDAGGQRPLQHLVVAAHAQLARMSL